MQGNVNAANSAAAAAAAASNSAASAATSAGTTAANNSAAAAAASAADAAASAASAANRVVIYHQDCLQITQARDVIMVWSIGISVSSNGGASGSGIGWSEGQVIIDWHSVTISNPAPDASSPLPPGYEAVGAWEAGSESINLCASFSVLATQVGLPVKTLDHQTKQVIWSRPIRLIAP